jgi:hypothetical protein
MLVYDDPVPVGNWVAAQGGGFCPPGTFTAMGYVEGGDLIAGLVFHTSNGQNCFVNIALSKGRFPRALLKAGLYYVFKQLTLRRLTFFISSTNIKSQNLVVRLGAKREATLRSADIGGGDLFIYSLFPEDCWIWSVVNGKISRSPSESGPEGHDSPPGSREPAHV